MHRSPVANAPLGVHIDPGGASAAVLAVHAHAVEVVLAAPDGSADLAAGAEVVALHRAEHGVWRGHLRGVVAGRRYALRVHGPWEPARGHRHNPAKLLLDPYARAIDGEVRWGAEVFGHQVDEHWHPVDGDAATGGTAQRDERDSAGRVPWGVVVPARQADLHRRPRHDAAERVVYEAHVRGLTMRHPLVPPEIRGSYAALGHPAVLAHLLDLGVTTLELLPVHAAVSEPFLVRRGLSNYWGYSTLGFFAPEPRYASDAARAAGPQAVGDELAAAVEALHDAGLEVLLDVVYNHTCEGGVEGPTFSWRGLDAATYYRLDARGRDQDVTGTGNSLDFRNARVVQLALDSLRHWVDGYGVDGFRFDLAPALARGFTGYDPDHPFLVALRTDPLLSQVVHVVEPWDVGSNGWRTGQFPPPVAEWNDRYRDDVRQFWLGDAAQAHHHPGGGGHGVRHLATRLAGSADLFARSTSVDAAERGPLSSVNFVTAHDGFTLADLTRYERKHNDANGEGSADGHSDNRSWNHGVEGATDDPGVLTARRCTTRAVLATLLLSAGTPMLTAGDELGRTQGGNNNAYCLDDETTWLDWGSADEDLRATVRRLLQLRRQHPALRRRAFSTGRPVTSGGTPDLVWLAPDGAEMDHDRWHDPGLATVQMLLHAPGVPALSAQPATSGSDCSLLVLLHAGADQVTVRLPRVPGTAGYRLLWDSGAEHPDHVPAVHHVPGADLLLPGRTVQLQQVLPLGATTHLR